MNARPEPPIAGDDTATMLGSLERQRATFAWKCAGVDEDGLNTTVGVSTLTLGGLLLHLALVEDLYFSSRLGGSDMRELWPDADLHDPDWEWKAATERTPEALLATWQRTGRAWAGSMSHSASRQPERYDDMRPPGRRSGRRGHRMGHECSGAESVDD